MAIAEPAMAFGEIVQADPGASRAFCAQERLEELGNTVNPRSLDASEGQRLFRTKLEMIRWRAYIARSTKPIPRVIRKKRATTCPWSCRRNSRGDGMA